MSTELLVHPVDSADDFAQIYYCISETFGRQINDTIWLSLNSQWESPEGKKEGAARLLKRWQSATQNNAGQLNTVFLKATLPDPQDETKRKIVGITIWQQASFVDGHGDPPQDGPPSAFLAVLDSTEQRFATQMFRSLWKRRISYAREKAQSDSPAIFILDTCATDPSFQRRGIAAKMVQWGLDEAKRRGGLECTTEASPMGRIVYKKLGFATEGLEEDLVYEVEEEFVSRDKPEILFMRTWAR